MDAQTKGNARAVCLEQSASAPAHKEAKKWKTPYERALERVCACHPAYTFHTSCFGCGGQSILKCSHFKMPGNRP
jgi:hypothetical protein